MTVLNQAKGVFVGSRAAQRIYLGPTLVWEPATQPAGPPVTQGLLWYTDTPINYAMTGGAVPAISMARAAGPLYVVISYSQAATPGDDEPAIFYIGNPTDNLYTVQTFYVRRSWGTGIAVETAPGRGQIVALPAPPSEFIAEMWASSAGSNLVDHSPTNDTSWYMEPIPNHNPAATSHLFIGHKPDGANAARRGAGQIKRMAVFDRVPNETERTQLVEWVKT